MGRLGGPERLRKILDIFYQRVQFDPLIGFFFAGQDLAKIREGQWQFLMRAFQETERLIGTHPSQAHLELAPILKGHFDRRLLVLGEVLEQEGVHPLDIKAWLKVEEGMRRLIQVDEKPS